MPRHFLRPEQLGQTYICSNCGNADSNCIRCEFTRLDAATVEVTRIICEACERPKD